MTEGFEGDTPPEEVDSLVSRKNGFNKARSNRFLNKTEVTTKAYVALDYDGQDVKSLVPVVF